MPWPTDRFPSAQEIYDRLRELAGNDRYDEIVKVFDFETIANKGGPTQGVEGRGARATCASATSCRPRPGHRRVHRRRACPRVVTTDAARELRREARRGLRGRLVDHDRRCDDDGGAGPRHRREGRPSPRWSIPTAMSGRAIRPASACGARIAGRLPPRCEALLTRVFATRPEAHVGAVAAAYLARVDHGLSVPAMIARGMGGDHRRARCMASAKRAVLGATTRACAT